ncbi:MAG: hypothetical protein OHK0015_38730 [Chloroflexi bacterium OHK40]
MAVTEQVGSRPVRDVSTNAFNHGPASLLCQPLIRGAHTAAMNTGPRTEAARRILRSLRMAARRLLRSLHLPGHSPAYAARQASWGVACRPLAAQTEAMLSLSEFAIQTWQARGPAACAAAQFVSCCVLSVKRSPMCQPLSRTIRALPVYNWPWA